MKFLILSIIIILFQVSYSSCVIYNGNTDIDQFNKTDDILMRPIKISEPTIEIELDHISNFNTYYVFDNTSHIITDSITSLAYFSDDSDNLLIKLLILIISIISIILLIVFYCLTYTFLLYAKCWSVFTTKSTEINI